jgi:hypothetical protein
VRRVRPTKENLYSEKRKTGKILGMIKEVAGKLKTVEEKVNSEKIIKQFPSSAQVPSKKVKQCHKTG